jgi:hypothetical protein
MRGALTIYPVRQLMPTLVYGYVKPPGADEATVTRRENGQSKPKVEHQQALGYRLRLSD